MSHPLLCIWQNRRRLDLESGFFAQGNFERYKMFLQRFRVWTPAGDPDENDSLICLPTNQIICAEVGCSQVFSSLRMVRFLFSSFSPTSRILLSRFSLFLVTHSLRSISSDVMVTSAPCAIRVFRLIGCYRFTYQNCTTAILLSLRKRRPCIAAWSKRAMKCFGTTKHGEFTLSRITCFILRMIFTIPRSFSRSSNQNCTQQRTQKC